MSSTFFISDLHLDADRPQVTAALAAFLETHRDCDALYILGDLFEAWVGDDDDAPLVAEVSSLLQRFSTAGPELFLMHGNRDFLIGPEFCARSGATLIPDPTLINLYDVPTLLLHGDSLCTSDTAYQAFRRQARSEEWQADILGRSLPHRRELAAQLRHMSTEAVSNKAEDIVDVSPEAVATVMAEHGVPQLIHGHTHRPARHEEPKGVRWVLGDWEAKGWVIEASSVAMELINFDILQ